MRNHLLVLGLTTALAGLASMPMVIVTKHFIILVWKAL